MIIELVNVRIAMAGMVPEMIERGTGIGEIGETGEEEVIEMTEGCRGAMLDVMISTGHHEGTETFSKVVWKEVREVVVGVHQGVIEMSLHSRWVVETGRRARALPRRRRNPLQI